MNQLLQWLAAGDLRSDGLSNEVVRIVLQQPALIPDLVAGLEHPEAAVRGHTADALEKIGRSHPELLVDDLPRLLACARQDGVAMVRMHLAMLFGHLVIYEEIAEDLVSALLVLLADRSVFTASWAIVSLCILGRLYPRYRERILQPIVALGRQDRKAIRSRIKHAVRLLTDETPAFPRGWVKSERVRAAF